VQELIKRVKPTVLLGLTGRGGLFQEADLREMAKHTQRPIVFPLSNPTSSAECSAAQAYAWTDGRAIVATGSPFPDADIPGRGRVTTSQCNNMFIFPGLGLGAVLSKAKIISDEMMLETAKALAAAVPHTQLAKGAVFPEVADIRDVSAKVAVATIRAAISQGVARSIPHTNDLDAFVRANMWEPTYHPIINPVN
jgi:malate dehydrogenase (oxaloacetate-decarboxylating)(NADP+)